MNSILFSRSPVAAALGIATLSDQEIDLVSGGFVPLGTGVKSLDSPGSSGEGMTSGTFYDGAVCVGSSILVGATEGAAVLVGGGLVMVGSCGLFANDLNKAFPIGPGSSGHTNTGTDMGNGMVDTGTSCGPGIATNVGSAGDLDGID